MKFTKVNSAPLKPNINITPLVDVVFILLIFFAVTTSFVYTGAIKVDLPKANSAVEAEKQSVVKVIITKDNAVFIDDEKVADADIESKLRDKFTGATNPSLVIEADKASMHGAVVRIIDLGKLIGFDNFAIATEEPVKH